MAKDVIITPASGKLDFYGTSGGSVLANINLTNNNDLSLNTTSGNLIIGDASRDVYIGDGTNEVDIVFEQNGEIRSVANKYITVSAGQVNATGIAVNTSSPNAVVHVYGSTPSGTVLNVEGTNGSLFSVVDNLDGTLMSVNNNAGLPVLEVFSDDSVVAGRFGQNDFVISSSGNVGIGKVPSNDYKLDVNGSAQVYGTLTMVGAAPYGVASIQATAGSDFSVGGNEGAFFCNAGGSFGLNGAYPIAILSDDNITIESLQNISLTTNFIERVYINSSGYVGIGTTSPSTKLDVNGTVTATSFSGAGTGLTGTASSLTVGAVTNGVYTTSNQSIGGVKTFTSQIINTTANSTATGGGQLYLNGTTGNRIDFNINGLGGPSIYARSIGTKINLYPSLSTGSAADFAIGLANDGAGGPTRFWQSVNNSSSRFEWFAGGSSIATLSGGGQLTVNGTTKSKKFARQYGYYTSSNPINFYDVPDSTVANNGTVVIYASSPIDVYNIADYTAIDGEIKVLLNRGPEAVTIYHLYYDGFYGDILTPGEIDMTLQTNESVTIQFIEDDDLGTSFWFVIGCCRSASVSSS
jgi:hypothetical protein